MVTGCIGIRASIPAIEEAIIVRRVSSAVGGPLLSDLGAGAIGLPRKREKIKEIEFAK